MVNTTGWEEWVGEDEEDIRLMNWGQAFKHGYELAKLFQPGGMRPPETIFAGPFDYRVDLWRAACTIYALLFASYPLFFLGDDVALVESMIALLGDLPQQWQAKWAERRRNSSRSTTTPVVYDASKLQSRFDDRVKDPELLPLLPIICGLMQFQPCTRPSAAEALELLP